jgi:ABC-type branched-subunit amino acid transport system ATPase component
MMLQLSGVHAHYGHIHALHGVDLDRYRSARW